jgi:hypothetical protein
MRACSIAESNFRNYGANGWWRTPAQFLYSNIRSGNKYGTNGFWHNPLACQQAFSKVGETEILSADVYYRFDLKTTVFDK